jgi:hypothetical protein
MKVGVDSVKNQLQKYKVKEGRIIKVDKNTGDLHVVTDLTDIKDPIIIPPVYYGGTGSAGIYQHPDIGDTVIYSRVFPGGKGIFQALRIIPKADRDNSESRAPSRNTLAGRSNYPTKGLMPGELKAVGAGGGELYLFGGDGAIAGIFLGNEHSSGLFISKANSAKTNTALVSDSMQLVSSAHRITSRDAIRIPSGFTQKSGIADIGNDLKTYNLDYGMVRGIYPGFRAARSSIFGDKRNPALSEYRIVINEISESDYFRGWDVESGEIDSINVSKFSNNKETRAISQENALHLAPHQLIEIIAGNVINSRGELLDPNYGRVVIGNAGGRADESDIRLEYEKGRLQSRRGMGYHFQLSTNSLSNEVSNNESNFIFSIDKEGALKANIPATSDTGNIFYPNFAEFYSDSSEKIETTYNFRKKEKIPITLRDAESGILIPSESAVDLVLSEGEGVTRFTGIRHSNDDSYFQGLEQTAEQPENIRINPTKHHNIYAAAEMLIANTINSVLIPFQNTACVGFIPGNSINKSFERSSEALDLNGEDSAQVTYMAAVGVSPGSPAIDPGGGVLVAGKDLTLDFDENDNRANYQYTNSFAVSKNDDGDVVSTTNVDESGESRKASGGKSANLNFEGAIEASVGADHNDMKSIILDTAGSMIAWFGKDKNNRSLILQTDGDALINVGGTNGDKFNEGRFELRVNVNHKGFLGEEAEETNASDYIISISKNGLVIAGMNTGSPMIIRNDGDICLESTSKLILAGQSVEVREGNQSPRKTYKDPISIDTPTATIEGFLAQVHCLIDYLE